jgi:uncharacterized protein YbaR (Trm112 family)
MSTVQGRKIYDYVGDSSISNGRVERGVLFCDGCNSPYDIRNGVPDLLIGAHSAPFKTNSRNSGNLDKRELSLKMEKLSIS